LKYNLYMRSYDAIIFLIGLSCFAQSPDAPKRAVTDPGVVTTRQSITPAGAPMVFDGRVYGVTFGKTADDLWILTAGSVWGASPASPLRPDMTKAFTRITDPMWPGVVAVPTMAVGGSDGRY
jgi:hypothetical protein